jgi:hypothetical protein
MEEDAILIEKARVILGNIAKDMTDDQLKDACVEIQYLIETWLDEFERSIFDLLQIVNLRLNTRANFWSHLIASIFERLLGNIN